jgi:energy-coupling factor transport system permease protein
LFTVRSLSSTGEKPGKNELMSAGLALTLCFILSLAAILFRSPAALCWLSLANSLLIVTRRPERRILLRGLRLGLWQGGVVTGLYLLRYGPAEGMIPGLLVSWQLLLVFLPGLILLSGTSGSRMANALEKLLPPRSAFVLTASLKFLPMLVTEISSIYEAQCLRGAKIRLRDQLWPGNWLDLLHCLIAPAVVRVLEIADNIACAARTREFGRHSKRTCWPGDQEEEP